jgi:Ca-activated chloride channel family protein
MSFGSPLVLLLALAIPAGLGAASFAARRRARSIEVAFTNLPVLASVAVEGQRGLRRYVPLALLVLALMIATAATAHPQATIPVRSSNTTIVLVVDVSGSMRAVDVEPSRLDAAVAALRGFVQQLPKGVKVGLIEFSDFPVVLATPTPAHGEVSQALDALRPSAGTAIGDAIHAAIGVAQNSMTADHVVRVPGARRPAAIVLLSDGTQTQGYTEPLAAAAEARAAGIAIDTVALGKAGTTLGTGFGAQPVPPDPELMGAIAKRTGGTTGTATNNTQLNGFYRRVGRSFGQTTKTRDLASWFAAAAAVMLLGAIGLSRLWAAAF